MSGNGHSELYVQRKCSYVNSGDRASQFCLELPIKHRLTFGRKSYLHGPNQPNIYINDRHNIALSRARIDWGH